MNSQTKNISPGLLTLPNPILPNPILTVILNKSIYIIEILLKNEESIGNHNLKNIKKRTNKARK
jgi:hypothetical protein